MRVFHDTCNLFYYSYSLYLFFFLQRVFYFPLRPKLRALLRTEKYWDMCQHEFNRPRNSAIWTDVYDGTAWKEFMGPCDYPNDRLGLQGCGDGIPAFSANTLSLKPWMWMNLSLPPGSRTKPKYMLLFMLLQQSIKQEQQRKYFDFAAKFELNELSTTGIDGIKVKVFATSLDTKGREELSGISYCLFHLCIIFLFQITFVCTQACRLVKLTKAVLCAPIRGVRRSNVVVFMMGSARFCRRIHVFVNKKWNTQVMCTNTRAGNVDQGPKPVTLHLSIPC